MNPKTGAIQSAKTVTKATPFEQIREVEEQEKDRVERTLKQLAESETEAAQTAEANRKKEEEELTTKAKEELVAFKNKELSHIIADEDKKTTEELKAIEALYKKNSSKVTESLVEKVLKPDFFSTAA